VRGKRAELTVVWIMRVLALSFFVVGIMFIADPNGTIARIEDSGRMFGSFAAAPLTDQKLWLGLAFAYMMVITAVALVVQLDVVRYRVLLLILAVAKAASSLSALAFYLLDAQVFVYLLNFIVDGGLVLIALYCWYLAGMVERPRVGAGAPGGATA
jgi:hypothetical protein